MVGLNVFGEWDGRDESGVCFVWIQALDAVAFAHTLWLGSDRINHTMSATSRCRSFGFGVMDEFHSCPCVIDMCQMCFLSSDIDIFLETISIEKH